MKAYQIWIYENEGQFNAKKQLIATYFNAAHALEHTLKLIKTIDIGDDTLIDTGWKNGSQTWLAHGWIYTTIASLEEIEIL
jgi:hypothetical protein